MVLHNPNNWHWVNKDTSGWAKNYLETELIGLKVEDGTTHAKIDKILSMEGDVDVSQRKGKVITLFDVQLQLEYSGATADEENVSGRITVPEVAHDTAEDEYVFDIDIYTETLSKEPVKALIRKELTPKLRKGLATLGPALIAAHTKDLQHSKDYKPAVAPAKTYAPSPNREASSTKSTSATNGTSGSKVNTTSISSTDEFRTSAQELYNTFTDPQRLAAFTRAPPKVFEGAHVGGKYELFDGNVSGEFKKLEPPNTVQQTWRLKQWPAGHYSNLKIGFEQNDVDGVTVMRVEWTGVPVGQEEVTRRNWGEYYVQSIKRTFGFGTVL